MLVLAECDFRFHGAGSRNAFSLMSIVFTQRTSVLYHISRMRSRIIYAVLAYFKINGSLIKMAAVHTVPPYHQSTGSRLGF